jgi:hypothetical protein
LTRLQKCGDDGLYAALMAAYVYWLAPWLDEIRETHRRLTAQIREELGTIPGTHPRHPDIGAQLLAAYRIFLDFAAEFTDDRVITRAKRRARACMEETLEDQAKLQEEAKIGRLFLDCVTTACASQRCYIEAAGQVIGAQAVAPPGYERACGWNKERVLAEWSLPPNTKRVGFLDVAAGMVYLLPGEAIGTANNEMRRLGRTQSFAAVGRELLNEKLCVPHPEQKGNRTITRATGEKRVYSHGKSRYFWISLEHLFGDDSDEPPGPSTDG